MAEALEGMVAERKIRRRTAKILDKIKETSSYCKAKRLFKEREG